MAAPAFRHMGVWSSGAGIGGPEPVLNDYRYVLHNTPSQLLVQLNTIVAPGHFGGLGAIRLFGRRKPSLVGSSLANRVSQSVSGARYDHHTDRVLSLLESFPVFFYLLGKASQPSSIAPTAKS